METSSFKISNYGVCLTSFSNVNWKRHFSAQKMTYFWHIWNFHGVERIFLTINLENHMSVFRFSFLGYCIKPFNYSQQANLWFLAFNVGDHKIVFQVFTFRLLHHNLHLFIVVSKQDITDKTFYEFWLLKFS